MNDTILSKRGEEVIRTTLRRTKGGIRVTVKVHPTVEALFQSWALDEKWHVADFGREWEQIGEEPLECWAVIKAGEATMLSGFAMRLDSPGRQLYWAKSQDRLAGGKEFNFSFIRLVGASRPEGVSFDVRGAYSLEYLKRLNEMIKESGRRFYSDYLLPVDLTVSVVTQEIKL